MSDLVIEKLCERWKVKKPEMAIFKAVYSTFPDLPKMQLPIDLFSVAMRRGVTSIQVADMDADGLISLQPPKGYEIKLNRSHSLNRQRFTCGHEIGHTFFFDADPERVRFRFMQRVDGDLRSLQISDYEERLCNRVASELLLPEDPFRKAVADFGLSAQSLVALGKLFGASLWAVARRFVTTSRHQLVVALWEHDQKADAFKTAWLVESGRRHSDILKVNSDDPFYVTLRHENFIRGRRWVSLGGPTDDYFVDGVRLQSSSCARVLSLFILEKSPEKLLRTQVDMHEPAQRLLVF